MGKILLRRVIKGRMSVTQVKRQPGKTYTVEVESESLFGRTPIVRKIEKQHKGHLYVEVLVYASDKEEGEPVGEWEMPIQLRYDLEEAASVAVLQQIDQEARDKRAAKAKREAEAKAAKSR